MAEKREISEDQPNKTLKSIFNLLHGNLLAYMKSSDLQSEQLLQMRTRRVRRSRTIKASSCPPVSDIYHVKNQGTSMTPPESPSAETNPGFPHELTIPGNTGAMDTHTDTREIREAKEATVLGISYPDAEFTTDTVTSIETNRTSDYVNLSTCATPGLVCQIAHHNDHTYNTSTVPDQHLRMARENVEMKVQMQEVNRLLKNLKKNKKDNEEEYNDKLATIDGILSKVVTAQKQSEVLCDKLCEGLEQIPKHQSISTLPPDLKDFCSRVGNTVGQDFRQIGKELGLEEEVLDQIENDFLCDEDCFQHIILEWCKQHETPSYHALVSACHNVNPDILKCKPLSKIKGKILQQNYDMMVTEMLEIHVLPHLVSTGIITFKMQRYVLQPDTRDQRINRLISIIYTRENGFDELCKALDNSDQGHVSSRLRHAWNETLQENAKTTTDDDEIGENFMSTRRRILSSSRCQSLDSSDDGSNYLADSSFSDSTDILRKIYEMIIQTGIPPK